MTGPWEHDSEASETRLTTVTLSRTLFHGVSYWMCVRTFISVSGLNTQ